MGGLFGIGGAPATPKASTAAKDLTPVAPAAAYTDQQTQALASQQSSQLMDRRRRSTIASLTGGLGVSQTPYSSAATLGSVART